MWWFVGPFEQLNLIEAVESIIGLPRNESSDLTLVLKNHGPIISPNYVFERVFCLRMNGYLKTMFFRVNPDSHHLIFF